MKLKLMILSGAMGLVFTGFGQLAFSVSPGLSMNSASLGYKFGKIVPFIGFQYAGVNVDYSYAYQEFDSGSGQIQSYTDKQSAKINLYVPNIGVKYFFKETESLKAFAMLNIAKPLVTGRVKYDGAVDRDFEDFISSLSIWGGELSAGVEYYFDEHFSVGGEFGLRYLRVNSKLEQDRQVYNPITDEFVDTKSVYNAKFNGKPTFSKLSLNFYF